MNTLGKFLVVIGLLILVIGIAILIFGNIFSWFGKLPGDIKIQKENFTFYAPITSMILISVILSLIINFIMKLFK